MVFVNFSFSVKVLAEPSTFTPDFSGNPMAIPAGTPLIPLCNNPLSPLCINQWSYQSIPMLVDRLGMPSSMDLFVPTFIPLEIVPEANIEDSNWNTYTPPSFSSRRRYRFDRRNSRKRPSRKRDTDTPVKEKKETTTGVPDKDGPRSQQQGEKPLEGKNILEKRFVPAGPSDQKRDLEAATDEAKSEIGKGQKTIAGIQRDIQLHNIGDRARLIDTDAEGISTVTVGRIVYVSADDIEAIDRTKTDRRISGPPPVQPEPRTNKQADKAKHSRHFLSNREEYISLSSQNKRSF